MKHWMDNWLEKSAESQKELNEENRRLGALHVARPLNPQPTNAEIEHSLGIAMLSVELSARRQMQSKKY
ncbi:MAG: hypothetical protein KC680_04440 [Candidatus Peregrinibacteria bacterium]|nr:hypothetical protein [Candidatus Peregrinibacteria bacterium]MCB9808583.1 hypothetical protein [Candidatus Peribacteria bacterium]